MAAFELVAPASVDAALATLRAGLGEGAVPLAGGTDLLPDLDAGRADPRRVVSLRRLPWRTLDWNGASLVVGATLPLRQIEVDPGVRERLPGLHAALRAVGSVALRHRATLGGNLARAAPASDLIPILLALDAEANVVGPAAERTISVDALLVGSRRTSLGPAELIRSVRIPEACPSAYLWQRVRPANDISQVAVAAAYSPSRRAWRLAVGGVPPRAIRLPDAEAVLTEPRPDAPSIRRAAELAARIAPLAGDKRASEEYRRQLLATLVTRAIRSVEGAGPA